MYLLDTDHITILQRPGQPERVRLVQRLAQQPPAAIYFSIVSLQEQTVGANAYVNRARTAQELLRGYGLYHDILKSYAGAQVLPFDAASVAMFDSLRAQRLRVGTLDLRIASIARVRNLTVLTRNLRDFRRVPGLATEDWTL